LLCKGVFLFYKLKINLLTFYLKKNKAIFGPP
jgi:hypothetical protein